MNATALNAKWGSLLSERPSFARMTLDSMHQVVTATFAMRIEVRYDDRGRSASMMLTYVSDVSVPESERWTVIESLHIEEVSTWQAM